MTPTYTEVCAVLREAQEEARHAMDCAYLGAFYHVRFIRGSRKQEKAREEARATAPSCDCFVARITDLLARLEG
jgi:hypothetical protein